MDRAQQQIENDARARKARERIERAKETPGEPDRDALLTSALDAYRGHLDEFLEACYDVVTDDEEHGGHDDEDMGRVIFEAATRAGEIAKRRE